MTVITYFSHDVSDTAVARRIRMLRLGGAEINLLGFRRSAAPIPVLEGVPVIDLGQSFGGRLGKRCLQLSGALMKSGAWLDLVAKSDIVMARNLEMATLANVVRRRARSKARLVYECLDIHGTQLSSNPAAKLLRGWEKYILGRSSNLIISSSSHLTNYFARLGINLPDVMLVENKRVVTNVSRPPLQNVERHPPWRIGWFGLLRCAKSLEILSDLARRYPDLVDITIRGRPTYAVEPLLGQHLSANMRFEGPYTEADLPAMYGACDLVWAVEYAGQNATNARWALGNRLYEGTFYNVPVIALADTAMGAWLEDRFIGIRLSDDCAELLPFLSALTPAKHQALRQASANLATTDLVCTVDECQRIVDRLAGKSEPALVAA